MKESPITEFHLDILLKQIKKYWYIYVICIIIVSVIPYLIIRYTHPVFKSDAIVQVRLQKTIENLVSQINIETFSNLDFSMELLSSEFLLLKAIDKIQWNYDLFSVGEILEYDIYKSLPFEIHYKILDSSILEQPIFITIEKPNKINISYTINANKYEKSGSIDQIFDFPHLSIFIKFLHDTKELFEESFTSSKKFKLTLRDKRKLVREILEKLEVYPLNPRAGTIYLAYQSINPKKCEDILNAILDVFILEDVSKRKEAILNQINFVDNQIKLIESQLETYSLKKLPPLQNSPKEKTSDELQKLKIQINKLKEIYNQLEKFDYKNQSIEVLLVHLYGGLENSFVDMQIKKLANIMEEYNKTKKEYSEKNPKVIEIEKEIKEKLDVLKLIIDKEIAEKSNQLNSIAKNLLPSQSQIIEDITNIPKEKTIDVLQKVYSSLLERKLDLTILMEGLQSENIILKRAQINPDPVYPNKNKIMMYAFSGLIVLWMVISFILYITYNKINDLVDLKRWAGMELPIIGIIPKIKFEKNKSILELQQENLYFEDSLRKSFINLEFMREKEKKNIICISSTFPNEGKSFIASNLAIISAKRGQKTILIDGDLRKPSLHEFFSYQNDFGLSNMLVSKKWNENSLRRIHPNLPLDLIMAGPLTPNPPELIMSKFFTELLDKLASEYECVIIDAPPIAIIPEVSSVFQYVNYPIYVFAIGESSKYSITEYHNIQNVLNKKIAIIINKAPRKQLGTYSYYHKYYKYGYYYGNKNTP